MFMRQDPIEQTYKLVQTTRACIRTARVYNGEMLESLLSTQEAVRKTKDIIFRSDQTIKDFGALGPVDRMNSPWHTP